MVSIFTKFRSNLTSLCLEQHGVQHYLLLIECMSSLDNNLKWLAMDMKAQLDTVINQQRIILKEMTQTHMKNAPQLPAGVLLPLQTFEQVQ